MTSPTFTRRPAAELGPDVVRYTLDCRHGTTHADLFPGRFVLSDAQILAYLVERHEFEERCGCARKLRRRSGDVIGARRVRRLVFPKSSGLRDGRGRVR